MRDPLKVPERGHDAKEAESVLSALRYQSIKHLLDWIFAALLLIPLLPLLGLLALLIRLESRGPAIYRQTRVGRDHRHFTIFKFRSMKFDTPTLSTEEMQQQTFNPYTRSGPFLRRSNLDELPQIFNILRGEMSFIGPRPALPSQSDVNTLRHRMGVEMARPGITGLAQVRGRDDLDVATKVFYDAQYCRTMNLKTDLTILAHTVVAVLNGRGNK